MSIDFMLAKEYVKGMKAPRSDPKCLPPVGWFVSEKFDGYRCRYMSDTKQLLSRQQKLFLCPEKYGLSFPDENLDGELWVGRDNFEYMGVVRKKKPLDEDWIHVKYVVYDLPDMKVPFSERIKQLKTILQENNKRWNKLRKTLGEPYSSLDCPIVIATQTKIQSNYQLNTIYQNIIKQGGEGVMLKDPSSMYEDKRSNYMLKYKPSFDEEAIIVGYKLGKGKYEGMLGGFICQQLINKETHHIIDKDPNHSFSISGMDDSIRDDFEVSHPKGTIISYEHSGKTSTGKPRFARYIRIRDDITILDKTPVLSTDSNKMKEKIIFILNELSLKDKMDGRNYQSNSYLKVIDSLSLITKDSELTDKNITSMKGVGKSIYEKIKCIIQTGTCPQYEKIKNIKDPRKVFLDIHGVGPSCASKLVRLRIKTIQELRESDEGMKLLNDKQKIGLKYYEPLLERIPYEEIVSHEKFLQQKLQVIDKDAELTIAGSYRRKKSDSGDIDVLVTSTNPLVYKQFIQSLQGYLIEDLAKGRKKYNGICSLNKQTPRRIDIMYTDKKEYPFAILYFTGSKEFNTTMRAHALSLGYTMNEHSITFKNDDNEELPVYKVFNNEKDIFTFLDYEYVLPENR